MRCKRSGIMVMLGLLVIFLLIFSAWKTQVIAEDKENLVGWWKMNESEWTGKQGEVKDASGHGNDLSGDGWEDFPKTAPIAPGVFNRAGIFNGKGQYLYAPAGNQDLAVGTGDFTLLAWVKSNNLSTRCAILGQQACDYGDYNYGFYQRNHAYHFIVNSSAKKGEKWWFFITRPIRFGWHHLAGVREGDKIYFYIDGKLRATREGAGDKNPDKSGKSFVIGSGGTKITEFFDGLITDVKLYKSALSPEQIAGEYNRLKDTFPQAEEQEVVAYEQGFEQLAVGVKTGSGISGNADMDITDKSHYTSSRALRIIYHPGAEKDKQVNLSPSLGAPLDCTCKVSLRVKFEDVVQPQNRKWLYPYIRVNVYDEKGKNIQTHSLLYSVTTTDSESSADDNWIMLKQEFKLKEGASRFQLVMYVYEKHGTSGTVYIDDIKIIQKFK